MCVNMTNNVFPWTVYLFDFILKTFSVLNSSIYNAQTPPPKWEIQLMTVFCYFHQPCFRQQPFLTNATIGSVVFNLTYMPFSTLGKSLHASTRIVFLPSCNQACLAKIRCQAKVTGVKLYTKKCKGNNPAGNKDWRKSDVNMIKKTTCGPSAHTGKNRTNFAFLLLYPSTRLLQNFVVKSARLSDRATTTDSAALFWVFFSIPRLTLQALLATYVGLVWKISLGKKYFPANYFGCLCHCPSTNFVREITAIRTTRL